MKLGIEAAGSMELVEEEEEMLYIILYASPCQIYMSL